MKQLIPLFVLFAFAAACDTNHSSQLKQEVSSKQEVPAHLEQMAKKCGFSKVEYELIKQDLTGDPFKIKLYLYSGRSQNQNIEKVSKELAFNLFNNANDISDYKLIEVNLINHEGQTAETIFYTSKLARI